MTMLIDTAIRATLVAGLAAAILAVARVRSSAVQHAVWTLVLMAMLLMPALAQLVPPILVAPAVQLESLARLADVTPDDRSIASRGSPVLSSPATTPRAPAASTGAGPAAPILRWPDVSWIDVVVWAHWTGVGMMLLQLAAGWYATERLRRAARMVPGPCGAPVFESSALTAPATVGVFVPRIILPPAWASWSHDKCAAVIAHERAHVRRRDPLVALLAHLNRSLFWWHPLAWWLERKLAVLAEQACDDHVVREGAEPRRYAEVLLEVARDVRSGGGRVAWSMIRVAGRGALGQRIDRLLAGDAYHRTSRARALAVAISCAVAVALVAACRQEPAPLKENPEVLASEARTRERRALENGARQMSAAEIAALEAAWKQNPEDFDALRKILMFYRPDFSGKDARNQDQVIRARRSYILWLIQHHPDYELAGDWIARIFPPRRNSLPDPEGYDAARVLWLAYAARPEASAPGLGNAAVFFEADDKPLAEQMLLRARDIDPAGRWSEALGRLYAHALVGSDTSRPLDFARSLDASAAASPWTQAIRDTLATTTDARLLATAGQQLTRMRLPIRQNQVMLDFDPVALGTAYLKRAVQLDPSVPNARQRLFAAAQDSEDARRHDLLRGVPRDKVPETLDRLDRVDKFLLLPNLAETAYTYAEFLEWYRHDRAGAEASWAQSKRYAEEALVLGVEFPTHRGYGVVVFSANVTLATNALREGSRSRAVTYMEAAGRAPASDAFLTHRSMLQPRLTNYLLKYGERESVAAFLERAAALHEPYRELFLADAKAIRAGIMPRSFQSMFARERY